MTATVGRPASAPPMAGVLVRAATPAEHDRVGELTVEGFSAGPYPPDAERAVLLRDAAGRAATADLRVAVDTASGEPLGTSTLARGGTPLSRFAAPDELELRLLAVAPAARGRGVGALLLDDALDVARHAGLARVVLDTGARNETSQRLYHRHGFDRLTAREDRLGRGGFRLAVFGREVDRRAGLSVRLVRPHEVEEVGRLTLQAYAHDHELPAWYAADIADARLRAREHEVWVAEDVATATLLGTATLPRPGRSLGELAREGELDLRLLATAPHARGRGVGTALVRHAVEVARWRGLHRLVLNSGPRMTAAHSLYRTLGFRRLFDRETRRVPDGVLLAFGLDVDARS